jgi:hypothetical protein
MWAGVHPYTNTRVHTRIRTQQLFYATFWSRCWKSRTELKRHSHRAGHFIQFPGHSYGVGVKKKKNTGHVLSRNRLCVCPCVLLSKTHVLSPGVYTWVSTPSVCSTGNCDAAGKLRTSASFRNLPLHCHLTKQTQVSRPVPLTGFKTSVPQRPPGPIPIT